MPGKTTPKTSGRVTPKKTDEVTRPGLLPSKTRKKMWMILTVVLMAAFAVPPITNVGGNANWIVSLIIDFVVVAVLQVVSMFQPIPGKKPKWAIARQRAKQRPSAH